MSQLYDGVIDEYSRLSQSYASTINENESLKLVLSEYEALSSNTTIDSTINMDSVFIYQLDYFTGYDLTVESIVKDNLGYEQYNVITNGVDNTYIINNEYKTISGTIFIPYDDRNSGLCSLEIWGDEVILYSISVQYGEYPITFSVDISNVEKLYIYNTWTYGGGLADCILNKETA